MVPFYPCPCCLTERQKRPEVTVLYQLKSIVGALTPMVNSHGAPRRICVSHAEMSDDDVHGYPKGLSNTANPPDDARLVYYSVCIQVLTVNGSPFWVTPKTALVHSHHETFHTLRSRPVIASSRLSRRLFTGPSPFGQPKIAQHCKHARRRIG